VLGGLLAFLVFAAAIGFIAERAPDSTGSVTATDARLRTTVDKLKAFVAEQQGKPFLAPVEVEALDDEEFRELIEEGGSGGDDFDSTLRGLGAADPGEDLDETEAELLAEGIAGLYDASDDVLYLRGRSITPFAQMVLVHELTHAWQDQHYDIQKLDGAAATRDEYRAVQALIEGDARRMERLWLRTQPDALRERMERLMARAEEEAAEAELTRAERSTVALLNFPYDAGLAFAEAVARDGGREGIAEAYRRPPTSTEQVLHPDKFQTREPAIEVDRPPVRGQIVDSDVLGEAGLAIVVSRGDVDDAARAAVTGWEGDAYATWRNAKGETCTDGIVLMEDRAARDRLIRALRARPGGETVRAVDERKLEYSFCEPKRHS
jgi:hypothetical protein